MSWQATSWAKGVKTGSPSRKAVLMILAEHCDQWGYAWAGVELIVEEAELGYRQVRRVLQELVKGGLIGICEPVKPGRGRFNLYRFAYGASAKAGPMPPEHPSRSETIGPCRWAESSAVTGAVSGADSGAGPEGAADGKKGVKMSPIPAAVDNSPDAEKGDMGAPERGHLEHGKGSPMTPEPIEPDINLNARATPPLVDNSGDARAEPDPRIKSEDEPRTEDTAEPTGPPPACSVWREAEGRLKAVPAWGLLCRAIPDADDGETLTLAVEAPWVGYAILAWACGGPFGAEALVGRRIECRVRRWVQAALAERGQFTAGKPSLAAHRRDGVTVRLDDPAWAAWQAARAEHPECAWLDCALPDDIEDDALVVRVGDARHMTQMLDGAAEILAAAVGMAVKPRYGGDMDAALRAQRAGDPLRVVGDPRIKSEDDPRMGTEGDGFDGETGAPLGSSPREGTG
jgi:hypothetical protein